MDEVMLRKKYECVKCGCKRERDGIVKLQVSKFNTRTFIPLKTICVCNECYDKYFREQVNNLMPETEYDEEGNYKYE